MRPFGWGFWINLWSSLVSGKPRGSFQLAGSGRAENWECLASERWRSPSTGSSSSFGLCDRWPPTRFGEHPPGTARDKLTWERILLRAKNRIGRDQPILRRWNCWSFLCCRTWNFHWRLALQQDGCNLRLRGASKDSLKIYTSVAWRIKIMLQILYLSR